MNLWFKFLDCFLSYIIGSRYKSDNFADDFVDFNFLFQPVPKAIKVKSVQLLFILLFIFVSSAFGSS